MAIASCEVQASVPSGNNKGQPHELRAVRELEPAELAVLAAGLAGVGRGHGHAGRAALRAHRLAGGAQHDAGR